MKKQFNQSMYALVRSIPGASCIYPAADRQKAHSLMRAAKSAAVREGAKVTTSICILTDAQTCESQFAVRVVVVK